LTQNKTLSLTTQNIILGWRVGEVAFKPHVKGLRKLRPQVELQRPQGRKARALATEQKRNVHPANANEAC